MATKIGSELERLTQALSAPFGKSKASRPFASNCVFNNREFSDIIVKVGSRKYHCHKIILCYASEYFKAMCGRKSKFAESQASVIELHEDEPKAVEALLRYIYNFDYEYIPIWTGWSVQSHLDVYVTANKYLFPDLAFSALCQMSRAVTVLEDECTHATDTSELVKLIKILIGYGCQNPSFNDLVSDLSNKHLANLMEKREFRQLLEVKGNESILLVVLQGVKVGTPTPVMGAPYREVRRCDTCAEPWLITSYNSSGCPFCYIAKETAAHSATTGQE